MTIPYKAYIAAQDGHARSEWNGYIRPYSMESSNIDVWITARGSCFHCIIGSYSGGNYICIPGLNIGTGLAELNDSYWNMEHLQMAGLCPVDAATLSHALVTLYEYL